MAQLIYPSETAVQLWLEANEDAILTVVRHCQWWIQAEVQGRLPGSSLVAGVVLTAERGNDATIREILLRSFQLSFPAEGGEGTKLEAKSAAKAQRIPR